MEPQPLEWPFDRSFLESIAWQARQRSRLDLTDTVSWLLAHRAPEEMVRSIRKAWSASPFVFRFWAERIDSVEPWCTDYDLGLTISVIGESRSIDQCPPLPPDILSVLLSRLPAQLPDVLEDLLCTAPGLSIDDHGLLAHASMLRMRLAHFRAWFRDTEKWAQDWEGRGEKYPVADDYVCEIAETAHGDLYLLSRNGELCFFDHEEMRVFPCRTSVFDLVDTYIRFPERLVDPISLGWMDDPFADSHSASKNGADEHLNEADRLRNKLPTLALLALALRAVDRGLPDQPNLDAEPSVWSEPAGFLRNIALTCRDVCCSGNALDESVARTLREELQAFEDDWDERIDTHEVPRFGGNMAACLRDIVKSCASLDDWESARGRHWSIETEVAELERWDAMDVALVADAEFLLSLRLGTPGTKGRTVPRAFFDRPQWPDGL